MARKSKKSKSDSPGRIKQFIETYRATAKADPKLPLVLLGTFLLVLGIFAGAMVWWIILTLASNHFRDRFNDHAMLWMNRIAGLAIGGFGVITMILSHWAQR